MTAPGQRIQGSLATLPFGASSLSLIGTSLEINENDILCSSCSRHRMLQKGPSQFITHSIYIAMALKHYLWDVNFLSAVNNLYRVEGEWKKDCEYIYISHTHTQWRSVLFEFKLPSWVFTFSSKWLCFPPSIKPFRAVKGLTLQMLPQGNNSPLRPFLERSKQTGRRNTRAICHRQSHRHMSPLLSLLFCNVAVASVIFLACTCNALNGPNWAPGSLGRRHLEVLQKAQNVLLHQKNQISPYTDPWNWAQAKRLCVRLFKKDARLRLTQWALRNPATCPTGEENSRVIHTYQRQSSWLHFRNRKIVIEHVLLHFFPAVPKTLEN